MSSKNRPKLHSLAAVFIVAFLSANLNAQTRSYTIRNRPGALRSNFRYPTVYAELNVADKSNSGSTSEAFSDPAFALAKLVVDNPDQRLFTLDWQTQRPEVLYRVHFDRKRRMLWFQKIEVGSFGGGTNQCFFFSGVGDKAIIGLSGISSGGNSNRKPTTIKSANNISDRFLAKFEIVLMQGGKMKPLPISDIPNFGSRRKLSS